MSKILLLLFASTIAACATLPPDPVRVETVQEASGTVEAVDGDSRTVTLRDETGEAIPVELADSVRSFAHVRVGDRIVVRFYTVLAAELHARGDASGETEAPVTTAKVALSPEGARPGGVVGTQTHRTVRIISVNTRNHVVTFYGSDGLSRSLPVRTPAGREFIRKLKVGDEVDVTYTEGVVVSAEPGT